MFQRAQRLQGAWVGGRVTAAVGALPWHEPAAQRDPRGVAALTRFKAVLLLPLYRQDFKRRLPLCNLGGSTFFPAHLLENCWDAVPDL